MSASSSMIIGLERLLGGRFGLSSDSLSRLLPLLLLLPTPLASIRPVLCSEDESNVSSPHLFSPTAKTESFVALADEHRDPGSGDM